MKIKLYLNKLKNKKKRKELKKLYLSAKNIDFQIDWLSRMSFGNGEGERDKNLNDLFIETHSIKKMIDGEFNYVLAPKGCGKSALFKAYKERFLGSDIIKDDRQTIIIPIDNVFAYETIDLKQGQVAKQWAIIWGVNLIKEIFKVITSEKYKNSFDEFLKKSNKYNELKEEFELYNLWDYIEKVNIGLKFLVRGQEISISPTINRNKTVKKIILNEIFYELQNYLQETNRKIYVLIDRVDDFVLGEKKEDKRSFIQGIYYSIEEISNYPNIVPILFLRTDLYYNLNIDSGMDKIQIRTIELKWRNEELTFFIFKRLFGKNQEIRKKYRELLTFYVLDSNDEILERAERINVNEIVDNNHLFADAAKKFVYTFFPHEIKYTNSENQEIEIDFFEWVYKHFEDYTGYINLRYLIAFFNKLFDMQSDTYEKSIDITSIQCKEQEKILYYPIFSYSCINATYHEIQKIALINIRSLLSNEMQKNCFDEICRMTIQKKGNMNYGDIQYIKYGLNKEEYENLLESLCVLGYLKKDGKKYSVPVLYHYMDKN